MSDTDYTTIQYAVKFDPADSEVYVTIQIKNSLPLQELQNEIMDFIGTSDQPVQDFFLEDDIRDMTGELQQRDMDIIEHLLKFGKLYRDTFILHGTYARDVLPLFIGSDNLTEMNNGKPVKVEDKYMRPRLNISADSEAIVIRPESASESMVYNLQGEKWYHSGGVLARLQPVYSQKSWDVLLTTGREFRENEMSDFIDNFHNYWNRYVDFNWTGKTSGISILNNKLNIELFIDYSEGFVKIRPLYKYGQIDFDYNDIIKKGPYIIKEMEDSVYYIKRDPKKERRLFLFFFQYNFKWNGSFFVLSENRDIIEFLINGFKRIPADWAKKLTPEFRKIRVMNVRIKPVVRISMSQSDKFGLSVNCTLKEDFVIDPKVIKKHIDEDDEYIKISDTRILKLINLEEIRSIMDDLSSGLGCAVDSSGQYFSKIFFLPHLINHLKKYEGLEVVGDSRFTEMYEEMTNIRGINKSDVPPPLDTILREYQKEGFYWMNFLHKYHLSGVLADDMGLGKTVQALTLVKTLKADIPSIVVCPKSLMHNWAKEIRKFTPDLKTAIVEGGRQNRESILNGYRDFDIIITSYSLLRNDIDLYQGREFYYAILDEAQHIKNYLTKVAKSVKKINSRYRLVLTGTPMENSLRELWSIFDFLIPGYLGSRKEFTKNFEKEFENGVQNGGMKELNDRIRPFILRRTKEEVLTELPPKIEQTAVVPLTPEQKSYYDGVLENIRSEIFGIVEKEGYQKSKMHILSALIRLRQMCNHPGMIYPELASKDELSVKLDLLKEILAESMDGGHRILLFSQFVKMLHIIRDFLRKEKINFEYLDGKSVKRLEIVDHFNDDPDIPIILVSLKAGGTGLNITGADTVIHFDPWWNPMVEKQATDRAYRMGQKKTVNVYKFITENTIEEKIIQLQNEKKHIFDSLDFTDSKFLKNISWDDLKILFE